MVTELCSVVFVLRPAAMFPMHKKFMGRAAHRLFLVMLNHAGFPELAQKLHDLNGALPFTLSEFFPHSDHHIWMRVTGLTPELCLALEQVATSLPGREIELPARENTDEAVWSVRVEAALLSHHEWASRATYATFIHDAWRTPPEKRIMLEFVSPTAIKSVGVYRPFPEPALVFRLLYERLLKLGALTLPFQPEVATLEAFAESLLEVRGYQIESMMTAHKGSQIPTFYGQVTYQVLGHNSDFQKRAETRAAKQGDVGLLAAYHDHGAHRAQYLCLLHTLAAFAFYSGLGSYTGQGMGMVRMMPPST